MTYRRRRLNCGRLGQFPFSGHLPTQFCTGIVVHLTATRNGSEMSGTRYFIPQIAAAAITAVLSVYSFAAADALKVLGKPFLDATINGLTLRFRVDGTLLLSRVGGGNPQSFELSAGRAANGRDANAARDLLAPRTEPVELDKIIFEVASDCQSRPDNHYPWCAFSKVGFQPSIFIDKLNIFAPVTYRSEGVPADSSVLDWIAHRRETDELISDKFRLDVLSNSEREEIYCLNEIFPRNCKYRLSIDNKVVAEFIIHERYQNEGELSLFREIAPHIVQFYISVLQ
ncbi:hypothetical protein QA648_24690 (plasmid) [Rhizobium sp. CB3171]|uniref:hypothetical protein n=1 Tax=Rhizobium sp. CB3171 TaxID=3039157 RepID=UPI0024B285B4|nr:hypothetical protein [Rhizobium sp. CB3171]WFU06306.1 hypothetical protein QA648_24690 [Rhizobium sp. CB3171]